MNEKVKMFFVGIFTAVLGFLAFIGRSLFQDKRNRTDQNRADVERLRRQSEEQQSANSDAIRGIDEALETIGEIRKRKIYMEDSDILDQWYCSQLFSDDNDNSHN